MAQNREILNDEGFSLLEVLMALLLTSLTMLACGWLIEEGVRSVRDARERQSMVAVARNRLEMARAGTAGPRPSPAGALDANVPGQFDLLDATATSDFRPGAAVFTVRWRVQPATRSPGAPGHIVRVRVLGPRAAATRTAPGDPGDLNMPLILYR